jgi:hypothetical protein
MSLSFDATYYQGTRPDVYNAFVATAGSTGLTWAQFAENHYDTFGRFEGSNPTASFDTSFYLTTYPDVAAAGINPFTHFLQFGSAEDRQPFVNFPNIANGQFVPATYAAANPDLAAAGITSNEALYQHFVTFGQFEGRSGAPTVNTPGGSNPGTTQAFTTTIGESLVGTDGDDIFSGTADAGGLGGTAPNNVPATINVGDTVDGGAGTDTLNIVATSALAPVPLTSSNVEIVNLISDVPANTFAAGTANAANFTGVTQLWQLAGTASQAVTGVSDSVTVGFNGTAVNNITGATGLTTANVALVNATTAGTIIFAEAAGTTTSALTTVNVSGGVTAAGANASLVLDLDTGIAPAPAPTGETTVNLALTTAGTATGTEISIVTSSATTFNAAGSTANLFVDGTGVSTALAATFTTATGGSGNDTITGGTGLTSIDGGAGNDTLSVAASTGAVTVLGGAGNDVITGPGGAVAASITGGTGRDTINAGAGVDTIITDAGDSSLTFATIDQIVGFATGTDQLDFNLAAGSATNFLADASSTGFVDGLSNANTAFNGTIQYFLAVDIADVDPVAVGAQTGDLLYVDSNLDGTADFAIAVQGGAGAQVAFGDIIA